MPKSRVKTKPAIKAKTLTVKEKLFADAFLVHLNRTKAAIEAGYPKASAKQRGHEAYNRVHVKKYLEKKLKERTISADETIKLISDTAQASVTDYFKPVMVERRPLVKYALASVIKSKQEFVNTERLFIKRAELTEDEKQAAELGLTAVEREIIRLQIELEQNPNAFRILPGPAELVEEMQLDINALVADKEQGKVKKVKYGKDGLEVEMYPADAAQDKLMKIYGKYAPEKSIVEFKKIGKDLEDETYE